MGISGVLRTSTSGMAAQANRISAVSDNIANVSTTGYKRASSEFSSFIPVQATGDYASGSVTTTIRRAISEQGQFNYTTSVTDLAVNGDGFMLVSDSGGQFFMTRAGNFVPNGDGDLINAGGFALAGYNLATSSSPVVNGTAGLETVSLGALALQASPSDAGTFYVNMPSEANVQTVLPSSNAAGSVFTGKTSLVAVKDLGVEVTLDIYSTKTAANTWEVTVYDRAGATVGSTPFPYSSAALATATLTFDSSTGRLDAASPTSLTIPVPGGSSIELDMSQSSQLATGYTVVNAELNGNGPASVDRIEIDSGGTLYAVYENGARVASYQIPLARVTSPDNLTAVPGDVYQTSSDSGDMQIGFAGSGSYGLLQSSSLEQSTVDLAEELSLMIEAERNFQVNSKVFQTGSDLLDVVVNLKR